MKRRRVLSLHRGFYPPAAVREAAEAFAGHGEFAVRAGGARVRVEVAPFDEGQGERLVDEFLNFALHRAVMGRSRRSTGAA
jgi:hypothetical protein